MHEKQIQKLDYYIMQINSDTTLRQKIEKINILLTNNSSSSYRNDNTISANNMLTSNVSIENNIPKSTFYLDDSNLQQNDSTKNSDQISSTPILQLQTNNEANFYKIDILLIDLRKYIANSAINWNTRII